MRHGGGSQVEPLPEAKDQQLSPEEVQGAEGALQGGACRTGQGGGGRGRGASTGWRAQVGGAFIDTYTASNLSSTHSVAAPSPAVRHAAHRPVHTDPPAHAHGHDAPQGRTQQAGLAAIAHSTHLHPPICTKAAMLSTK